MIRENETEVVYVRRRVVMRELIDGKPRTKFPEYTIWAGILARCGNQNTPNWDRYGGRGITVCQAWVDDFRNFYRDMGLRPSAKHSVDRIDNDGNYEPGNCRWATAAEQAANKSAGSRDSVYFWTASETETLRQMVTRHYSHAEIASVIGRTPATVRLRASTLGIKGDASLTRLKRKFPELLPILREGGREKFIDAIAVKKALEKKIEDTGTLHNAEERAANVARLLSSDTDRSAKMKEMRGLGMNLSEIGNAFGITRERVRQIEALGWPSHVSSESPSGITRKVSTTKPEVLAKKVDRLCRAWNRASREARLLFLEAATGFIAQNISLADIKAPVSSHLSTRGIQ